MISRPSLSARGGCRGRRHSWTEPEGNLDSTAKTRSLRSTMISANASDTEPAKLLAVFVVDTDETKIVIEDAATQ
jgi:hypothetical protein